jgi:hypothetical protein
VSLDQLAESRSVTFTRAPDKFSVGCGNSSSVMAIINRWTH